MNKDQARKIYDHNKIYIEANINHLCWQDLIAFSKKQDELYLIFRG